LEEKWGGLQTEEYHPNREGQGLQHHVVGVLFARGGTGALHKIDGITRMKNYVDKLKKHLKTSVRKLVWLPTNLTQLHQLFSRPIGQNSPNLVCEACGRLPESLTQVKQFKGNATEYN
jgi:hypothetical protein